MLLAKRTVIRFGRLTKTTGSKKKKEMQITYKLSCNTYSGLQIVLAVAVWYVYI